MNAIGLMTLGLFRPYRMQESPDLIRKTCVLFLSHTENRIVERAASQGSDGREAGGRELWKISNLDLFQENLVAARVEDVVCVLKWVCLASSVLLRRNLTYDGRD